ncbi:MAG TPA: AI-2E family transporter [Rhizomicrobium sp.]|jgi:predicted PurR-regulated permease PerM|nr:AI-2E family transporter [Rhizomicrobium sp.]
MLRVDARRVAGWLVSAAIIFATLVVGRPLLVPLAFAVLIWAVLNALTDALKRLRLPPALAWTSSLLLIAAALYLIARILGNEADAVTAQAPDYFAKLQRLTDSVLGFLHLARAATFNDIFNAANVAGAIAHVAASTGSFLFTLAMIVAYVGFLLAEQPHLPEKLAQLQKDETRRNEAGQVIHAVAHQVQAYLGVCTFLSAIMAAATYALLLAMHVSFAGFWALVLFLATYLPTIGAAAVLLPALMALLQFGTFAPFVIIAATLGVLHFVLANVVSTIMLGRTLNLSPLGIILSLTFWGLIWGISGLFLAVPITGAFAIVCRHFDGLNWVAIVLAGPERKHSKPSRSAPSRVT